MEVAPYSFDPGSARDLGHRIGPESGVAFFQDKQGRYATFRGVNFAGRAKHWPYLPLNIEPGTSNVEAACTTQLSALQPRFDEIRARGWNVVRLLVMWKGLEPEPAADPSVLSTAGEAYLRRVLRVVEEFRRRGIFVFLDFHQDIAHEVYNGDGFPDWALAIDPDHRRPTDADFKHSTWATDYTGAPRKPIGPTWHTDEVRHTLRSFWTDELRNDELSAADQARARHPRTHLVQTIGAVARWVQEHGGAAREAIVAYQLFNEPHQVGLGKENFERHVLPPYYRAATAAIRRWDDRAFVMVQPRVDWNVVKATAGDAPIPPLEFTLEPTTYLTLDAPDPRSVFTYHHYDPWTPFQHILGRGDSMENKRDEWPAVFDKMRAAAVARGLIPFITELGANHVWDGHRTDLRPELYRHRQTRAYIDLQMQQTDRQVLNWTYWHYNPFNTGDEQDGWNLEDFSLLGPGAAARDHDLVCRPYPMRSSAEPLRVYFDAESRACAMHFKGAPVSAPTVVYVPRELHYTADFDVRASSARIEWDGQRQLLYWWPDPAKVEHALILSIGPLRVGSMPLAWISRLLTLAVHQVRLPGGAAVKKVTIQGIVADPPGRDIDNEIVVVANPTGSAVDLTGWRLQDRAGHRFTFPRYTLAAAATVRIWTRQGTDGPSDLHMGRRAPIWNNTGDEAVLLDAGGAEVSRFAY